MQEDPAENEDHWLPGGSRFGAFHPAQERQAAAAEKRPCRSQGRAQVRRYRDQKVGMGWDRVE